MCNCEARQSQLSNSFQATISFPDCSNTAHRYPHALCIKVADLPVSPGKQNADSTTGQLSAADCSLQICMWQHRTLMFCPGKSDAAAWEQCLESPQLQAAEGQAAALPVQLWPPACKLNGKWELCKCE